MKYFVENDIWFIENKYMFCRVLFRILKNNVNMAVIKNFY